MSKQIAHTLISPKYPKIGFFAIFGVMALLASVKR